MGYDRKPIDAHKKQIVQELFINTADDNYIAARWCFFEKLHVDYFWLAVHALEKYMKAALLINRRSGKSYQDSSTGKSRCFGHHIEILYEHVKLFASSLLPARLEQPSKLEVDYWFDESPEKFLQRIYSNGNPDNRYQIFGFQQFHENIFKLDMMVFALRRVCVPLDAYIIGPKTSLTYRDKLVNQPKEWKVSSTGKLEKTISAKRSKGLHTVLLNLNFPFSPDDFPHGELQRTMASQKPVLKRLILDQLTQTSDIAAAKITVELTDWALNNIKIPKDVENEIENAQTKCKTKWKI